jgi:hypothetical protein
MCAIRGSAETTASVVSRLIPDNELQYKRGETRSPLAADAFHDLLNPQPKAAHRERQQPADSVEKLPSRFLPTKVHCLR